MSVQLGDVECRWESAGVPWELLGHTCSTREVLVAGWQLTGGSRKPQMPCKGFCKAGELVTVT